MDCANAAVMYAVYTTCTPAMDECIVPCLFSCHDWHVQLYVQPVAVVGLVH